MPDIVGLTGFLILLTLLVTCMVYVINQSGELVADDPLKDNDTITPQKSPSKLKLPKDFSGNEGIVVPHPVLGNIPFHVSFSGGRIFGVVQGYSYSVRFIGDTLYVYKALEDEVIWKVDYPVEESVTSDELGVLLGQWDMHYDISHMMRHKLGVKS